MLGNARSSHLKVNTESSRVNNSTRERSLDLVLMHVWPFLDVTVIDDENASNLCGCLETFILSLWIVRDSDGDPFIKERCDCGDPP